MNIRRTRSRTQGTIMVPDYSSLAAMPLVKTAPCGQSFNLKLRAGIFASAFKSVAGSVTDTLEEGQRVYEVSQRRLQLSFSALRRFGSWVVELPRGSKEMAVSTTNVPTIRLSHSGGNAFHKAVLAQGYWTSPFNTSWCSKVIASNEKPLEDLYQEALAEAELLRTLYGQHVSWSLQSSDRFLSAAWCLGANAVPNVEAIPTIPEYPDEMLLGSPEMLNARYAAWEALSQGGASIGGLNKLQAVLEMKDVPATFKQVFEFAHFIGTRRFYTRQWREHGASLVTMAQAYLWYKFGVKPTVDDANKWVAENLMSKAVAVIEPAENMLRVGDTVRCAYQVRPDTTGTGLPRNWWTSTSNVTYYPGAAGGTYTVDPLTWLQIPVECDPSGFVSPKWEHEGVMFARALKPGLEMMPNWFWDLYPQAGDGEIIEQLSKTRLALVINPPLTTMFDLTGWSWMSNWVGTFSKTLSRLERAITGLNIRVTFERLWACDRWRVRPRWPKPRLLCSPNVTVDTFCDVRITPYIQPMHTDQTGWWVDVRVLPECKLVVSTAWSLETSAARPSGGAEHLLVIRDEIPKPHIPPVHFKARVGATRTLILGALSITKAAKLMRLFGGTFK